MSVLSPRLQRIYDYLVPGYPVWDFCCDHGYLGLQAYASGLFPEIHFVDQVPEIIRTLESRFLTEHFEASSDVKVFFHACPGEDIEIFLEGTLVIAGVGSHTIAKIFRGLNDRGQMNISRLIFCPQNGDKILNDVVRQINQLEFTLRHGIEPILERGRRRNLLIFDKN